MHVGNTLCEILHGSVSVVNIIFVERPYQCTQPSGRLDAVGAVPQVHIT